jgi:hypothetical protein
MVYSAPKSVIVRGVTSKDLDPELYAVQGAFYNLRIIGQGWHPNPNVLDITADSAIVHDVNGATKRLTAINLHITDLASLSYIDNGSCQPGWYTLYLIYNPTTGQNSILYSLDPTTPALPTGYTHYARMGNVFLGQNASYFTDFTQLGSVVTYNLFVYDNKTGGYTSGSWNNPITNPILFPPLAKKVRYAIGSNGTIRGISPYPEGYGGSYFCGTNAGSATNIGNAVNPSYTGWSTHEIGCIQNSTMYLFLNNTSGAIVILGWEY